jgi:hypothetical protein
MQYTNAAYHMRFIAVVSLLLFGQTTLGQEAHPDIDLAALADSMEQLNQKFGRLRSEVDQTRFDPDAWLEDLDYDADAILAAVTEQIAFQPYPGVLRGVAGTLKSRSGNSLDQALLLAYLLKTAGYDARIVKGTLGEPDIGRLLRNIGSNAPVETLAYMQPAIEKEFGSEAIVPTAEFDWSDSTMARRTADVAGGLLKTLAASGIDLKPRDVTARYVANLKEYFWVQHRDGPTDSWSDAHPAFGSVSPPVNMAAEEYFADAIPEMYQHRLTVSAYLNQRTRDKVATHSLMSPFTRPIANLDGVALRYRNHPDGLTAASLSDIGDAIASTRVLLPMLNDSHASGGMAFDLNGRVIDPMILGGGASSLFATLADRLEEATSTVDDPDDPEDIFALESMWLEFRFDSPDGTETRIRRYILPPQVAGQTNDADLLWSLITEHTYVVNAGRHPADYLADRYLATGIASGAWYAALMHKFVEPDAGTAMPRDAVPQDFAPLSQYRFMDAHPGVAEDVISFRQEANLLGIRRGFRGPDVAFIGVDVVANAVAQLRVQDGKVWTDPGTALRRGVWDTGVEAIPAQSLSPNALRSSNAVDVLLDAVEQDIDLLVIKPGQLTALENIELPPSALASMHDDLAKGFAIVVPARLPRDSAMLAWWKVHPATGETLGITADGYGQELVEYLTDLVSTALGIVQAVQALEDCSEKPMVEGLCCLVEAHINNVAGLGFGGILGATVGTAGSALFTIVDFGTQAATGAVLGPEGQTGLMPTAALNCDQLPATDW